MTHHTEDRYQSDLDRWAREENRLDWFLVILFGAATVILWGWL